MRGPWILLPEAPNGVLELLASKVLDAKATRRTPDREDFLRSETELLEAPWSDSFWDRTKERCS